MATPLTFAVVLVAVSRTSALNAAFNSVTCENLNNAHPYEYYYMDTGGDDWTCFNIGQTLGDGDPLNVAPPFCHYYTSNPTSGPFDCPDPRAPLPWAAWSISPGLDFIGTQCEIHTEPDCADESPRKWNVTGELCSVFWSAYDAFKVDFKSFRCKPPSS